MKAGLRQPSVAARDGAISAASGCDCMLIGSSCTSAKLNIGHSLLPCFETRVYTEGEAQQCRGDGAVV